MRLCVRALCTKHTWVISGDNLQGLICVSCFENENTFASSQIWRSFPESSDFWKITCNIGASSAWRVCKTMGMNWSGPAALWGFRDLSSFSLPFTEICISGIWLYRLEWKDKLHPGHLALEVFDELRNWSVPGIWGWKQTGTVCLGIWFLTVVKEGPSVRLQWDYTTFVFVLSVWVVNTSF